MSFEELKEEVVKALRERFEHLREYEITVVECYACVKVTSLQPLVGVNPLIGTFSFRKFVGIAVSDRDYEEVKEVTLEDYMGGAGISREIMGEIYMILVIENEEKKRAVALWFKLTKKAVRDLSENPPVCMIIMPFKHIPTIAEVQVKMADIIRRMVATQPFFIVPLEEARVLFTQFPMEEELWENSSEGR